VWPWRLVEQLDLAIDDVQTRATQPADAEPRVAIVAIDDTSLARFGRWPWDREQLAALADELFDRQRAAVVAFDVFFPEPQGDGSADRRFAAALAGRAALLGGYLEADGRAPRRGTLPPPVAAQVPAGLVPHRFAGFMGNVEPLAGAAAGAGFVNFVPDADGLVRRLPLLAAVDGHGLQEPLALAALRLYTGRPSIALDAGAGQATLVLRENPRSLRIPVDRELAVRIPYRAGFERIAAADLLDGRVGAGALAGRIVLVGVTAPGAFDQRATPIATALPGVEIHASLLSGLLDGRIDAAPDWARGFDALQLLALGLLLTAVLPRWRPARAIAAAALAFALLMAIHVAARRAGLVLPVAAALLLTGLGSLAVIASGWLAEGRTRRSLERLFGAYVPPELVDEMARDPERYDMRAENRELTVMFCDMRNFTALAEALPPEGVRDLINRFFGTMTEAIRAERGTLDKYIGDAIMAFWGAPVADASHAAHAVQAALAMIERLGPLNAELRARGLPEVGLGIGLNTGVVCVGDMGSPLRRSYTVMGDAVNLASRIEGLTRRYGVDLLAGEATRAAAGEAACVWVEVDRVRVKGKDRPVTLFTPLPRICTEREGFDTEWRDWNLALGAYRRQHWDEARTLLSGWHARPAGSPFAGLVRQMDERIDRLRDARLAPDWDGATNHESK
jgi:adenylate cyclase